MSSGDGVGADLGDGLGVGPGDGLGAGAGDGLGAGPGVGFCAHFPNLELEHAKHVLSLTWYAPHAVSPSAGGSTVKDILFASAFSSQTNSRAVVRKWFASQPAPEPV